jgi:CheY-like chemotaxis protein
MKVPNLAQPSRILLVDDNKLGLLARRRVLEEAGHTVATACDGEQGYALFCDGVFDLLITDYKMPRMDGIELIRKIRSLGVRVPVIMISGYVDALGLTENGTGADCVIAKSANEVSHLVRAVTRLLKRAAPRKPAGSHPAPVRVRSNSV